MAKRATAERIVTDVREQQEITSHILPVAATVDDDFRHVHRDPVSGATAVVGQMDSRRQIAEGRPIDPAYQQRIGMVMRRLRSTHILPVTIINTLPVRLAVNSVIPALKVGVRECELDQNFNYFTWMDPVIDVSVQEGQKIPTDYNPMMMAEEYLREYAQIGGVMLYEGTVDQFREDLEDEHSDASKAFRACEEKGLQWQIGKVRQANDYWNTPQHQLALNITELHRACASRCMAKGRLGSQKPQWMDVTREVSEVVPACPSCGAIPERNAARCKACMFVLDPVKAFLIRDIKENDLSLQRLTRAQIEELGISDFIAETIDEYPDRVRRGEAMPISRFERKQIALEHANQEALRAAAAQGQHAQQP